MAPRPKVPFDLHPAARLRSNLDIAHGGEVALAPDGATAAILHGPWSRQQLDFVSLADGATAVAMPAADRRPLQHVTWSADGQQWAVAELVWEEQERRGVIHVGPRDLTTDPLRARVSEYGAVTRNAQARAASTLAFSRDGSGLVVRVCGSGERSALMHIALPDGAVREQWFEPLDVDQYAHAFGDDGTLYVLCADPGLIAGLSWFEPGAEAPSGHLRWPFGLALAPAPRGMWVAGAPRYGFRVGPGPAVSLASAGDARQRRAASLRARARTRWDQDFLDGLIARVASDGHDHNDRSARHTHSQSVPPPPTVGMRSFEHELLWETSLAARIGHDDLAITDGVAVFLWRDAGPEIVRTLLADDPQCCTYRAPRIIGLSAAGDTLALLWKKDARGTKTVLSLFDLDRAAL